MTDRHGAQTSPPTTRDQVVALLLREGRTVTQLAEELDLSLTAVRAHLTALEAEGLVEVVRRERGGVGKPPFVYELTLEGERFFPRAYGELFGSFLEAAGSHLGRERVVEILRDAGRRLARSHRPSGDLDAADRVAVAIGLVEELGGRVELSEEEGALVVRGFSCPLAEVVRARPDACVMLETLLSEILGAPVEEFCDKGPRPRCRFRVRRE
jgi:predicted ArsR family transcriptional regulator